ncbi:DNA adenine methylase [Acetatifactor aquisgranensis]|uniref:DNA adenine methylase n=1 Tax=Acetatifactor aquisgranensis TaxID=2941233 RepID=UPI0020419C9E|nr:DNA adenine methylase [Acetatifactor aquisgranensis]
MKAVFKYPGSKWSLAGWIISFFPAHHSYLEPFFGSGAVLFNKPRSNIETVNDLDGNVVNLFRCIREDPKKLADMIYMTPYAREVNERAYRAVPEDSFEAAYDFIVRLNMGHGFRTTGERVGWKNDVSARERSYASQDWSSLPGRIMQAAERLRGVQIESRPAIDVIRRFNFKNVLIYCDPPYMMETKHGRLYRYEMSDAEHEELLRALLQHKGPVLLSGYDTDLYRDMLCKWECREKTSYSQVCSLKKEVLWMNFEPIGMQMEIEDWRQMVENGSGDWNHYEDT